MDDDRHDEDPRLQLALARYQVISPYLALDPRRGQKGALLKELAACPWGASTGEPMAPAAETIRTWVRRYRRGGLAALEDKPRPRRGVQVLTPEEIELCAQLKREVPERSLERIIKMLEDTGRVPPDHIRRSTLHRALQELGLSARPVPKVDATDLDRFEADCPNDLWQSDMLVGPWLPDPDQPHKVRRAYLYAFLDDHSRLLLHGRFSFRGHLPALELVFRRCLQKYGRIRRVYYDNGQTYRSKHMRHIVAQLGIHRIAFTTPRRPEGHGKIEALNRLIRSAFLAELKASRIRTLDEINEAFLAWMDLEYNRRPHTETGEVPLERWRKGCTRIEYYADDQLRQAFLWREHRTPDKTGLFSLFGVRYQTTLGRKRVELRFDPEALDSLEVWLHGRFVERVRPFSVTTHRRPKPQPRADQPAPAGPPQEPAVDWLAHLVAQRQRQQFLEPSPRHLAEQAAQQRAQADQAILALLGQRIDPAVLDEHIIRDYLDRFGPFDLQVATETIDRLFAHGARADQHVTYFLDAIRGSQQGSAS